MQNHNVKFKNSAYWHVKPESVGNPGAGTMILKNKANLQNAKMNINLYSKKDYDSEPHQKQQQNKANFKIPKEKHVRNFLRVWAAGKIEFLDGFDILYGKQIRIYWKEL